MSNQSVFKVFVVLFLLLVVVFLQKGVQAQPNEFSPLDRLNPQRFEPIPRLDLGDNPSQGQDWGLDERTTTFAEWTKIVYQSYEDGNWEIYSGDDNGSDKIRLTNHSSSDIHPRFNRGTSRVVFASNRDGDYELFVMNADGSGLTQLTNNTTDDVNPAWSYDGTQIAFQTYRDGQADIYKMNSNGSAQTRLTSDGSYDGMPTWSPDGQKIAFVSGRSGGYRIYTMAANGNGQIQLSNQPFSTYPAWSPNGTEIAYSADADGDEWLDVWVMDADGGNQRDVYNPSGQIDGWVRSWSPESDLIAITEISFIQYQGDWYWTAAYLRAVERLESTVYYALSYDDVVWHPDWQTSDIIAPSSSIVFWPKYYQREGLDYAPSAWNEICWYGSDSGGAEIDYYDVEYRYQNEPWRYYDIQYRGECTGFNPLTHGDDRTGWYAVRGRAVDKANNYEAWPAEAEANILVYEWRLESTTQDNRGNPLYHVNIVADHILHHDLSGAANEPVTYFDLPLQNPVDWEKAGFLDFPETDYQEDQYGGYLYIADMFMPAADNLIADWGFENDSLLTAWTIDGTTITPAADRYHTGEKAVLLDENLHAISQVVTVPVDMMNPTLSFLSVANYSDQQPILGIDVTDGITEIETSHVPFYSWTHEWLDMTQWQGRTITVTLTNENPQIGIYVDEVTLSSAYPDVWIEVNGTAAALPEEQVVYEVGFGNGTNLDAYTNTITMTLPTGFDFVSASLAPTISGQTLSWDVGDLLADSEPQTIYVTATVAPSATLLSTIETQAVIQSGTAEVEFANNTAVHTLFIGKYSFLPVILR